MIEGKKMAELLRYPDGEMAGQITDFMARANRKIYHFVYSKMELSKGMNVLELGMANGAFVNDLFSKEPNFFYTGIDYSEQMVNESIHNNSILIADKHATFLQGNISDLPIESNSIDLLFTVNTHYFWEDFEKCKNEIIRVLKNGGQFIIGGRTKESLSKFEFSNYGFNLYSKEDFIRQFKSNQLSTIEYAFEEENIQFPDGNYGTIENICFFGRKN